MDKVDKVGKYIVLVLLTALITYIITSSFIYSRIDVSNIGDSVIKVDENVSDTKLFPLLEKVYNKTLENFYGEFDKNEIEQNAIRGMLDGFGDPYTYYMDEGEYENFNVDVSGNFGGIGLQLQYNTELNMIEVMTPLKNTPSSKTRIKTGDFVLAVNGVEYKGEELYEAVNNIRGEPGTQVVLTVLSGTEKFDITIERAIINVDQIEYEVLENNIGYINVISFDSDVHFDFVNAYNDLLNKGITSLIIDLRDNPGGYVTSVLAMADVLVPKGGVIVSVVDKNGNKREYNSTEKGVEIPMVVLINGSTASASEILAGALKDHGIATIVGVQSYGKGLIQDVTKVQNGGAIRVTSGEYFTPNNVKINGIGVTPDVVIEQNYETQADEQLDRAIQLLK